MTSAGSHAARAPRRLMTRRSVSRRRARPSLHPEAELEVVETVGFQCHDDVLRPVEHVVVMNAAVFAATFAE